MPTVLKKRQQGVLFLAPSLAFVLLVSVAFNVFAQAAETEPAHDGKRVLLLLEMDAAPDQKTRNKLAQVGVRLLSPTTDRRHWMATAPAGVDHQRLARMDLDIRASVFPSNEKLSKRLREKRYSKHVVNDKGQLLVVVQFADWLDVASQLKILKQYGAVVHSHASSISSYVVSLPEARLLPLAASSSVIMIEEALPPLDTTNDNTRIITGIENLHWSPYNLRGAGVSALVYDADVIYDHSDLETPRVVSGELPSTSQGFNRLHATHVAGILGGSGVLGGGIYRGMAPEASIVSYGFCCTETSGWLYTDPGDIQASYQASIDQQNIDLATNSLSTNVAANGFDCAWEGDYNTTAQLLDNIVTGALGKPVSIFWAVGNERDDGRCGTGHGTVPPPANAKNIVAVGSTDTSDLGAAFSSWGPTDDGRIKPDVVAPGVNVTSTTGSISFGTESYSSLSGTSQSTPAVAGLSALMIEQFGLSNPGEPALRPSAIKNALIHTALDLGNAGPDYEYGFGRVDGEAAVQAISDLSMHISDKIFSQGDTRDYFIDVPAGTPELKVSVAWDDIAAVPLAANTLVNDIDLELIDPSGATVLPWVLDPAQPANSATRGADHANVVELASVPNPAAGRWTLRLTASQLSQPQPLSLMHTPAAVMDKSAFPVISGFSPQVDTNGPENPTFIFVFGENFIPLETDVTVNGIHQPLMQVYSDTMLIIFLPPGDVVGPIEVFTPAGSARSTTSFGIPPQGLTISGFTPKSGRSTEFVFVFGSGFQVGTGFPRFFVNNDEIFIGQAVDDNLLIFMIQDYNTTGPITITTSEDSVTTPDNLLVIKDPPTVDSFNPVSFDPATSPNSLVDLTGMNYYDVIDVTFNGEPSITYGVITPEWIQAVIPDNATTGPICVITPGGTGCSATDFVITNGGI